MPRPPVRAAMFAVLIALACTNDISAPGLCPQFCPLGSLTVIDTVLAAISRDSAYGRPSGYVNPNYSLTLIAANEPGIKDSRPIMLMPAMPTRLVLEDTTTGPVIGVDSIVLSLTITTRDTLATNLAFSIYALPLSIDSTSTFTGLAPAFAGPPIRTVNVNSLLANPTYNNPVTGDSVLVDTVFHRLTLLIKFDSAQTPYSAPDTGKLAFGIRVNADQPTDLSLGAVLNYGLGPYITAYLKVDSLGVGVAHRRTPLGFGTPSFNTFVFDPPPVPLDSTLAVGGVPATRSILRIAFPRIIRDSQQIARATLELIPAVLPRGVASDSFDLVTQAVLVDLGAKSALDPIHVDTTRIYITPMDTVRIELTNLMRFWAADTTAPTAIVIRQAPEGGSFAELRMFASSTAAYRPMLHLTYSPSFPFGQR